MTILRLVVPPPGGYEPSAFSISEEFKYIFATCSSSNVLWILRENWHHYFKWIEDDHDGQPPSRSKTQLQQDMKDMKVECDGRRFPMSKTVMLQLDHFLRSHPCVKTIKIHYAQNPKWGFLSVFGVSVKRDAYYYIQCLGAFHDWEPDKGHLTYLYNDVQECLSSEDKFIT